MKCPSCGAEITAGRFCESCGSQITPDMLRDQEILNKQGCPKCGSTNIQIRRENQGEIREKNSKKVLHQTVAFCKDCGYTWYPNGQQKPRKTWLWVLGWIFIFPLPLTLILLKKKNLHPAIKYGVIAVAWILYLLFAFFGKTSDDKTTLAPTEPATDNIIVATAEPTTGPTTEVKTEPTTESEEMPIEPTTEKQVVDIVLSSDSLGDYGKEVTLNGWSDLSYTCILFYLPAGTYTVTNNDQYACQVSVYSGISYSTSKTEGEWDEFLNENCARPIVLMPNSGPQKLEVNEGQFVKLADNSHNIHFVLD